MFKDKKLRKELIFLKVLNPCGSANLEAYDLVSRLKHIESRFDAIEQYLKIKQVSLPEKRCWEYRAHKGK